MPAEPMSRGGVLVKLTKTATRALICAPGTHASSSFRSAAPFSARIEGTSVSRLRTMTVVAQDQTVDSAARGRPL